MNLKYSISTLILLVAIAPWWAQAQDKTQVIRVAAEALGMLRSPEPFQVLDPINRALFVGTGTMSELGRDGVWRDYSLNSFRQDMSYHQPAIRQHINRTGADGEQEMLYRVARGDFAWNEEALGVSATPAEPPDGAEARIRDVFITPHGFMTAVVRADEGDVEIGTEMGKTTISTTINGEPARAVLNADMRPETIEIQFIHAVLGETALAATYSGYRDFNYYLVFFPEKIVKTLDGRVILDLEVSDHHQGGYLVWPVPENIAPMTAD